MTNDHDPPEDRVSKPLSAEGQAKLDALKDAEIRKIEHAYRAWELTQTEKQLLAARVRHLAGDDDP